MNDARTRSVDALKQLYTVVIGVALSAAIYNLVDADLKPIPLKPDALPYFLVFVVLLIPFYHGAVRHLEATYVESGGVAKPGALLVDFIILFAEGCLFLLLALLLHVPQSFSGVLVVLLVLDAVWGLLARLAFTTSTDKAQGTAETSWAIVNFATGALLVFVLLLLSVLTEGRIWQDIRTLGWMLFPVIAARTVIDYWRCWDFYYPVAENTATTQELSAKK